MFEYLSTCSTSALWAASAQTRPICMELRSWCLPLCDTLHKIWVSQRAAPRGAAFPSHPRQDSLPNGRGRFSGGGRGGSHSTAVQCVRACGIFGSRLVCCQIGRRVHGHDYKYLTHKDAVGEVNLHTHTHRYCPVSHPVWQQHAPRRPEA